MRSFLELLLVATKPQAKALLKTASTNQVRALSEIALNVLEGVLPVKDLGKLSRHFVRSLGDRHKSPSFKRKLLSRQFDHLLALLKNVDLDTVCKNLS